MTKCWSDRIFSLKTVSMPDLWRYCRTNTSASYICLYNVDICQLRTVHFNQATKRLSLRSMSQRQACPSLEWNVHYPFFSKVFIFSNKGKKYCTQHKHTGVKKKKNTKHPASNTAKIHTGPWNQEDKGMTEYYKAKEGNERNRSTGPQRPNFRKGWVIWKSRKLKSGDTHWMIICEPKWEIWNKVMKTS